MGGTSLGAPVWAALIAIADGMRIRSGGTALNGASQTLPALYQAPASAFRKTGASAYNAGTGLGSPVAGVLVPYLAGFGNTGGSGAGGTSASTPAPTSSAAALPAVAAPANLVGPMTPLPDTTASTGNSDASPSAHHGATRRGREHLVVKHRRAVRVASRPSATRVTTSRPEPADLHAAHRRRRLGAGTGRRPPDHPGRVLRERLALRGHRGPPSEDVPVSSPTISRVQRPNSLSKPMGESFT